MSPSSISIRRMASRWLVPPRHAISPPRGRHTGLPVANGQKTTLKGGSQNADFSGGEKRKTSQMTPIARPSLSIQLDRPEPPPTTA